MFVAILALFMPLLASAADEARMPDRYIVVLHKAGAARSVTAEIESRGGTVEVALRDRLVVSCPATAVEGLQALGGVRYVQKFVSQAPRTERRLESCPRR